MEARHSPGAGQSAGDWHPPPLPLELPSLPPLLLAPPLLAPTLPALASDVAPALDPTEEDPSAPVDEAEPDIVADTPPVVGALVASPPELVPGPADVPALVELVELAPVDPSVVARGGAAHAGTSTSTTQLDPSPPRNIVSTIGDRSSAGKWA